MSNNKSSAPLDLFVSEDALVGAARRSELGMELLSVLSDYEIPNATDEETYAEVLAVLMTVCAYQFESFRIPELKAISEFRHIYKRCALASKRLGPRATARDIFAELSVMAEDEPEVKKRK